MKTIVEFGVRGGRNTTHTCPTAKAASNLAASLAFVFGLVNANERAWLVKRNMPRISSLNDTHFVSVSLLDGEPRGPYYTGSKWNEDRIARKPE